MHTVLISLTGNFVVRTKDLRCAIFPTHALGYNTKCAFCLSEMKLPLLAKARQLTGAHANIFYIVYISFLCSWLEPSALNEKNFVLKSKIIGQSNKQCRKLFGNVRPKARNAELSEVLLRHKIRTVILVHIICLSVHWRDGLILA